MLERITRILRLGPGVPTSTAPRLIVWDSTELHSTRLRPLLADLAATTGRRLAVGDALDELRVDDWHVFCWSCFDTLGSPFAARLSRQIQTTLADSVHHGFQTVVCWSVDRDHRPGAWITKNADARLRNNALMTMASTWTRLVDGQRSELGALEVLDQHTRGFLSDLEDAGELGHDAGVLRDQLDVLDPNGVQLLLTEPLAPTSGPWHGDEAVQVATRHRFGV